MDAETREQLIARFRTYLETAADEPSPGPTDENAVETDLFSLFTELAALRNEVRLESRQLKAALDKFGQLFDTLRESNERLGRELEARREVEQAALQTAERPLLLELLELRDRVEAGLASARGYRPTGLQRLVGKASHFIEGLADGMVITLRRLDELLARYRVRAVPAAGNALDPHTMHATAIESRQDQADGMVLAEVRRGYLRGDEVLRLAEVIVNKRDKAI
jgi:molecular chaperone GrpE